MGAKVKKMKGRVQHKGKTEAEWYLDVYDANGDLRDTPFIPLKNEIIIFSKDENNENDRLKVGDGITNVIDLPFSASLELEKIELPQEWIDINEAYEAIKEDDHKLLGGVIYKDFEGNIRVFPLAPPYGIRTDEVGEEYAQSSIAMYNSKQQLMVKPATDGRHTVPLSQLLEELKKYLPTSGGTIKGKLLINTSNPSINLMDSTDNNTSAYIQAYNKKVYFGYGASKSLSVDKEGNVNIPKGLEFTFSNVFGGEVRPLPAVDTSNPDVNARDPYLFCRDSENNFSKKVYAIHTQGRTIVERDENGEIKCSTPTNSKHAVNLEYLNSRLAELESRLSK